MDKELIQDILAFRDERNWRQYHNPKDLAISLSLEAAELLENFQWTAVEEAVEKRKESIRQELADILIYCVLLADVLGVEPAEIMREKLVINKRKYPPEKAYGKKDKYTEL